MYIKNDFIFLHVPKTAGTAMKYHFRNLPFAAGDPGQQLRTTIGDRPLYEVYEELKKERPYRKIFCNIRNPWDWHVSNFYHGLTTDKKTGVPTLSCFLNSLGTILVRSPHNMA